MSKPRLIKYTIQYLDKYSPVQIQEEFVLPEWYTIERIAGSGSYGVVAIGEDTKNNRKVAIKKNKKVFSHSIEYTKRILREMKILKHITGGDHPNCLSLLDLCPVMKDFDDIYEVFDAMDADLSLIIGQKDPCNDETIQYFIREILKGLKYLHSGDLLHRDLVSLFSLTFFRNHKIFLLKKMVLLKFVILDFQEELMKIKQINNLQN